MSQPKDAKPETAAAKAAGASATAVPGQFHPDLSASQRQGIRKKFFQAIDAGRAAMITQGFELGVRPTMTSPLSAGSKMSPLHALAEADLDEAVGRPCFEALIQRCDPRARNSREQTPLMVAAQRHESWLVKALLPVSDPDARDDMGMSALMHAASHGSAPGFLKSLIAVSDPMAQDEQGRTALMLASREGSVSAIQMLIKVGDPNAVDNYGRSALFHALDSQNDYAGAISALLTAVSPSMREAKGGSAFAEAVRLKKLGSAMALLPATELVAGEGETALYRCCEYKYDQTAAQIARHLGPRLSLEVVASSEYGTDRPGKRNLLSEAVKHGLPQTVAALLAGREPSEELLRVGREAQEECADVGRAGVARRDLAFQMLNSGMEALELGAIVAPARPAPPKLSL